MTAQAEGPAAADGWGTAAGVASAPEAVGQAAAGLLGGLGLAVHLEEETGAEPPRAGPGLGPEMESGAGVPPGAGTVAGGAEDEGLSAPRVQRQALCNRPGSSPGFSLDPRSWGQLAPHLGGRVQAAGQHLVLDLKGREKRQKQGGCERQQGTQKDTPASQSM